LKKADLEELKKLCEPVIEYIDKHHDPHTHVIVSLDSIRVVQDIARTPIENNED